MRYEERPLLIYWELTRACELACRHCRAEAIPWRDPRELSTVEGLALLDRLAAFGPPLPHLVLTGGDPLQRPDLFDLIAAARERGFSVALTPSGTYALTEGVIRRLQAAGVWMLALSLDGATAERHDALRGVPGSFEGTVRAVRWARAAGLPVQVNTLVCAETVGDLPAMVDRLIEWGVARWSLFFLVPTGRGRVLREISPEESERLMHWLLDLAPQVPFSIKTTEAPHYRRVAVQRNGKDVPVEIRRGFGVRDGNGIMFVSHIGEIYPAGFLPLPLRDVRREDPVAVYREHPVFRALRDPDRLKRKCGRCPFRAICGGSRARAYAVTGDPLESDPLCPYSP
ncbi:MAG: radical SAM/SPASM domain-containing protein [Thermoflexus sp.]|uniref:TIGR04053 family radical SAM/SPASM domain-containing protein n=1 Tax=Thermoflexus sp. TaxID=1969742 RepID=UPI00331AF805